MQNFNRGSTHGVELDEVTVEDYINHFSGFIQSFKERKRNEKISKTATLRSELSSYNDSLEYRIESDENRKDQEEMKDTSLDTSTLPTNNMPLISVSEEYKAYKLQERNRLDMVYKVERLENRHSLLKAQVRRLAAIPDSKISGEVLTLLQQFRSDIVVVTELVAAWNKEKNCKFTWGGFDFSYLLRIPSLLDFLDAVPAVRNHFGFSLIRNPLITPHGLDSFPDAEDPKCTDTTLSLSGMGMMDINRIHAAETILRKEEADAGRLTKEQVAEVKRLKIEKRLRRREKKEGEILPALKMTMFERAEKREKEKLELFKTHKENMAKKEKLRLAKSREAKQKIEKRLAFNRIKANSHRLADYTASLAAQLERKQFDLKELQEEQKKGRRKSAQLEAKHLTRRIGEKNADFNQQDLRKRLNLLKRQTKSIKNLESDIESLTNELNACKDELKSANDLLEKHGGQPIQVSPIKLKMRPSRPHSEIKAQPLKRFSENDHDEKELVKIHQDLLLSKQQEKRKISDGGPSFPYNSSLEDDKASQKSSSPSPSRRSSSESISRKLSSPSLTRKLSSPSLTRKLSSPSLSRKLSSPSLSRKLSSPSLSRKLSSESTHRKLSSDSINRKMSSESIARNSPSPSNSPTARSKSGRSRSGSTSSSKAKSPRKTRSSPKERERKEFRKTVSGHILTM
eukprot:g737.t1